MQLWKLISLKPLDNTKHKRSNVIFLVSSQKNPYFQRTSAPFYQLHLVWVSIAPDGRYMAPRYRCLASYAKHGVEERLNSQPGQVVCRNHSGRWPWPSCFFCREVRVESILSVFDDYMWCFSFSSTFPCESGVVTMVAQTSSFVMPEKLDLMVRRLIWLGAPKVPGHVKN